MARSKGSANLAASLEVLAGAPLDARLVVDTKSDLTTAATYSYVYVGMIVAVKDTGDVYILTDADFTKTSSWKLVGAGADTGKISYQIVTKDTTTMGATITVNKFVNSVLKSNTDYHYQDVSTPVVIDDNFELSYGDGSTYKFKYELLRDSEDHTAGYYYAWDYDQSVDITETFGAASATSIVKGYYKAADGKFYVENTYTTEIPGDEDLLYISLDTNILYYYDGSNFVALGAANTEVLQPGGSYLFANVPAAASGTLGFVYDIQDAFTTTSDFIEGAGHDYPAGTNIYVVNAGTSGLPLYKYDILSGNLDAFQLKMQYAIMPTASANLVGSIVQFVGTTDSTYTNGYFYECVEDSSTTPSTYSWEEKAIQAGGGSGSLQQAITAAIDVGGIKTNDSFPVGTSYDSMWDALLNPTLNPTFTNPSATLSGTGDKLLEAGSTLVATITATFIRGSITPAYGTSGYRSGAATDYTLNSGVAQAGNTWSETVSAANRTFSAVVNYDAGEQPKDSKGNNYDSPLAAGSVTTNTVSYEFVDALWANTSNIGTIAKLTLVSKSAKQKDLSFPAQTVANPEVFDVPASWTVTAVQVKNDLSGQYEDASSQFTVTDTTHDDAAGTSVAYKRYTFNLGYGTGARQVRIKWS